MQLLGLGGFAACCLVHTAPGSHTLLGAAGSLKRMSPSQEPAAGAAGAVPLTCCAAALTQPRKSCVCGPGSGSACSSSALGDKLQGCEPEWNCLFKCLLGSMLS